MVRRNRVVQDFGKEWEKFNYLDSYNLESLREQFENYLEPLPDEFRRRNDLIIADFGAGTGRWAFFLKEFASKIYAVEPAEKAFRVLENRFIGDPKVLILNESIEFNQVPKNALDLAVSLGVLHHIQDTQKAIECIASRIKPGGLFLCYLYYSLENKSNVYQSLWRVSEIFRKIISRFPSSIKFFVTDLIAAILYFPLAKVSFVLGRFGVNVDSIPLHHYKDLSFHVMRNDALDRFGTTLEKRFTQEEILQLLISVGFTQESIQFSKREPFWTFSAKKSL